MTDIERKKIIDKIISAPGELTPEEINAIKADTQLSKVYKEMCLTAAALFSAPEPDSEEVEQEFKRFASERLRRRSFGPPLIAAGGSRSFYSDTCRIGGGSRNNDSQKDHYRERECPGTCR